MVALSCEGFSVSFLLADKFGLICKKYNYFTINSIKFWTPIGILLEMLSAGLSKVKVPFATDWLGLVESP